MHARAGSASQLVQKLASTIRDRRVLDAIRDVPRDAFVPPELHDDAWLDVALPIGRGQTISQPTVVARMCELLELRGDETVLDVGTGSGYHAAVLGRLAARVYSIERHAELSRSAQRSLHAAGVSNVTLIVGDGARGHPEGAPYDAINVAAASEHGVPRALQEQLRDGGRLVIPTDGAIQRLVRIRRSGGRYEREALDRVRFVPLVTGDDWREAEGIVELVE